MDLSRRHILAGLGSLPLAAAAGCAAPYGSKQSYITGVVAPQNLNTVFHWVDVGLQSVRDQAIAPPRAAYAMSVPMAAGFAAANGIVQAYGTPFHLPAGPAWANPEAAYAAAFAYAASETFQQPFVGDRKAFFDRFPKGEATDAGITYGRDIASIIVKSRNYDNSDALRTEHYLGRYPRRQDILRWRPTGPFYGERPGPAFQTYGRGLFPGLGQITPWTMTHSEQFRVPPFLDPRSPEFARQFIQTKELGAENSVVRTPDQELLSIWWEDGPWGITPPGHFMQIAMERLQHRPMTFIDLAWAMALVGMTQCDAAISAWDSKYYHDIIRPESAIRLRAEDFHNPALSGQTEPEWRSLIPTPNFPSYTSGHSTFGAAAAEILTHILGGDNEAFSAVAPDYVIWPRLKGVRRSWSSLHHMAEENGWSRIYGGVHWEEDHTQGMKAGQMISRQAFAQFPRRAL